MPDDDLPNIIAVDDDYAVRKGMEFMFKKWPEYNLFLAEDPNDALAKLDEREYMMMFSDINMPVMSGLDLLKIVKEKMAITTQKRYYTSDYGFENTKDYIFGKTDKLIKKPNYDNYSFENLTKWWKKKAQKRWENVKANGKLRRELEFWNADNIDKLDIIR